MIVVLITTKNKKEAKKIIGQLIKKKLAACVNIIDGIESFFWWQGKVDNSKEALMVIKTKKILFEKLRKEVRRLHSYSVVEVIALPVIKVDKDYKKWCEQVTD